MVSEARLLGARAFRDGRGRQNYGRRGSRRHAKNVQPKTRRHGFPQVARPAAARQAFSLIPTYGGRPKPIPRQGLRTERNPSVTYSLARKRRINRSVAAAI